MTYRCPSLIVRCLFVMLAVLALAPLCLELRAENPPRVLIVGLNEFKLPSQAAMLAQDGDIIEIEAGTYTGDVAVWTANNLTIRGVRGRARLVADGASAENKAIWVFKGRNITVENIEFVGCRVPDRNGAGIRQEGPGLTVRRCAFLHNETGILTGAHPESDIVIEHSEFGYNGFGDGYSHNIYIGEVRSFTLAFSYSHHAKIGHLVKSRALANYLLYNRLTDEQDGQSSFCIDLPNGGQSFIIGNVIQQGARAENKLAVSYAREVASHPLQELYVINNTFVNNRQNGIFVQVGGLKLTVKLINNLVYGTKTLLLGPGEQRSNLVLDKPGFLDVEHFDYRLTGTSPAIGQGTDPGAVGQFTLLPQHHYLHPCESAPRPATEQIDVGAYQYQPPTEQ